MATAVVTLVQRGSMSRVPCDMRGVVCGVRHVVLGGVAGGRGVAAQRRRLLASASSAVSKGVVDRRASSSRLGVAQPGQHGSGGLATSWVSGGLATLHRPVSSVFGPCRSAWQCGHTDAISKWTQARLHSGCSDISRAVADEIHMVADAAGRRNMRLTRAGSTPSSFGRALGRTLTRPTGLSPAREGCRQSLRRYSGGRAFSTSRGPPTLGVTRGALAASRSPTLSPTTHAMVFSQRRWMTHYERLGIEPPSDPKEIKQAYFQKAKKCHPDIHGPDRRIENEPCIHPRHTFKCHSFHDFSATDHLSSSNSYSGIILFEQSLRNTSTRSKHDMCMERGRSE